MTIHDTNDSNYNYTSYFIILILTLASKGNPLKEPQRNFFSDPKDLLTRSWSSFATHWAGWSGDMPTFPLVLREGDARGLDCESKFYVEPGEGISTATLVLPGSLFYSYESY